MQLLLYQSLLLMVELLQLQDRIMISTVVYLELKILTRPCHIGGLRLRLKLEPLTHILSYSLHYNCLMLLVMFVKLQLVQATLQMISQQ